MVEVHFRISKDKFRRLVRQLRKRKHRLRDELHTKNLKGEQDIVGEADLMECELIIETLEANVYEPVPFSVTDTEPTETTS